MILLIEQCRKGDRAGQRLFYEKYADSIFRICLRYMGETIMAEDCVAETFIKIFKNIENTTFENEKMLMGWIKRIAVNECLMMLRKNMKFSYVNENEFQSYTENGIILSEMNLAYLFSLIQSLPIGYRTVFNLYAVEGFSHSEIAKMLKISEGTSKSQMNRARQQLKEQLKDWRE